MEPPPKTLFFQSQYIHKCRSQLTLPSGAVLTPILLLPFPSQSAGVPAKETVNHQQKDGTYPSFSAHMLPTLQLHSCHELTPKKQITARRHFLLQLAAAAYNTSVQCRLIHHLFDASHAIVSSTKTKSVSPLHFIPLSPLLTSCVKTRLHRLIPRPLYTFPSTTRQPSPVFPYPVHVSLRSSH